MARNRKHQSAEVRFGPALKAFLLCLFIAASSLGYVWQKNQIVAIGQQIKERETKLAELKRQNRMRSDRLAALCSPPVLEERIRAMNLGLMAPAPSQIVRIIEAPAQATPPAETGGLAKERPKALMGQF